MPRNINPLIEEYAGTNAAYYRRQFERIAASARFRPAVNPAAFLFGPLWFAARGLWKWFAPFALAESFALAQIVRGAFSDLGADEKARMRRIMETLEERRAQLAESGGGENAESLRRLIHSLEEGVARAGEAIAAAEADAGFLLFAGIFGLLAVKIAQSVTANWLLERHFIRWRSNKNIASGLSGARAAVAALGYAAIAAPVILRFSSPDRWQNLASFPAPPAWRAQASGTLNNWSDSIRAGGEKIFDAVAFGTNALLDGLESVLAGAPWPAVMIFIAFLAWQSAGARVAVFAVAGLFYLGVLGFWQQAMATMALLGAAACISISLGIPFGILCARRPRLFAVVRPVLDFMQTMPSFVYLIPVIAFFGTGKASAIMVTLVFGSPPVIRLTVLGLQNVPAHIREAAVAFGATPSYLLFRVDLPLAARTIMTGVNQTISLSLAMVVVASLIGAKGLGEVVLEALYYAATGEGILAGFAILFCAMLLDRIIQGARR